VSWYSSQLMTMLGRQVRFRGALTVRWCYQAPNFRRKPQRDCHLRPGPRCVRADGERLDERSDEGFADPRIEVVISASASITPESISLPQESPVRYSGTCLNCRIGVAKVGARRR
jgi:hypothetical protein